MYTGGTFHLDVLKRVLKVLPSLTTLALTGKKVTNQCAVFVAKLPFARNLTSVTLLSSKVTAEGAISLLGVASQLSSLTIHSSICSEYFLRQLSSRLSQARQGGIPLLSKLSIQDGYEPPPPTACRACLSAQFEAMWHPWLRRRHRCPSGGDFGAWQVPLYCLGRNWSAGRALS
jgi:hypothetical protein